jgi:hypothetical protein
MSTTDNRELEMLKSYIKGALDFPVTMEKGPRIQGYEAALQGVLDFINSLERAKLPKKPG